MKVWGKGGVRSAESVQTDRQRGDVYTRMSQLLALTLAEKRTVRIYTLSVAMTVVFGCDTLIDVCATTPGVCE